MAEFTLTATAQETGYISKEDNSWATVWGAAIGSPFEGQLYYEAKFRYVSPNYQLCRGRIRFDTSTLIPPISSAKIRFAFNRNPQLAGTHYLHFVGGVGLGEDIATSDFGTLGNNVTDITDTPHTVGSTFDTYYEYDLNAYGLGLINTDGYTIFGLRFKGDIDNSPPIDGSWECWTSWYGGVYDPAPSGFEAQLVVDDAVRLTADRVSGLVHRWEPGQYTLEVLLGGVTTELAIPDLSSPVTAIEQTIYKPPVIRPKVADIIEGKDITLQSKFPDFPGEVMISHHDPSIRYSPTSGLSICPYCKASFSTKQELIEHLYKVHGVF